MINDPDLPGEQEDFPDRLAAGMREEEFCRILDLRKNLELSDALIKHTAGYLSLGWHLAAMTATGQPNPALDFQQPEEVWSQQLMELSLDGVPINLGVRTGSPSGLLVLEVPRQPRVFPFRRDDWCSACVAEVSEDREQHYYELPEGWQLPASLILDPFQARIFGDGGLVLAPPSLGTGGQSNRRWLKAPWETTVAPPPPLLKKIIKVAAPEAEFCPPAPAVLNWEEIHPILASHAGILQALLAPAPSAEAYYQNLLEAAWEADLTDPELLLALLWHAPLGDAQKRPQGISYLQQLLAEILPPVADGPLAPLPASPGRHPAGRAEEHLPLPDFRQPAPPDNGPMAFRHRQVTAAWRAPGARRAPMDGQARPGASGGSPWGSWQELLRASQENLIVERCHYEAMIYELGKLEVWQEVYQKEHQENQSLKAKMDHQWVRELDYLRKLLKKLP